jgi:antitoxin component YwqK of YwqJK toxin-antitoxin module
MLMSNGSWSTIPSKITESANTTLKKSENGLPIYGIGDVSYNDNGVCIVLATKQKVTGIVDGGGYPKILTPYKDGLIDGIERRWYGSDEKSQLLYEKNYVNGKLIGWQRYYSESGKLLGECNLINGNGKIQVKYENGNLNWEENYLNGMLDGSTKSWLDNGKLIQEWQYKNGLLEGIAKSWFENGKLASESNYVKGELIKEQYWHPNGKRAYESNYKNGIMLDARSWYENGKRASEIFYKDGLIISEKCWEENGKKTFCVYNIGG